MGEAHAAGRGCSREGDIGEAMNAAAAVGDDSLQKQTQGYVVPTASRTARPSSAQSWFRRGFDKGDVKGCDTFSGDA